jgi:tetratricopeptide (TPR) repeat protein
MTRQKRFLMMTAGLAAFGIGFLTTLGSAPAQERFDLKVRDAFFAGFNGDQASLDRAMKACEEILRTNPKHAEALVWHGSGLYYRGGMAFQSGDPQKGMELAQRGLAEMAQAVELEPDNIAVRIPRGAILLQSTLFMPDNEFTSKLIQTGLEDYLRTLELQRDYFGQLSTHSRGELLFGIASGESRLGNSDSAERYFRRITEELKGSVYQKRADKWLTAKNLSVEDSTCVGCHVAGK